MIQLHSISISEEFLQEEVREGYTVPAEMKEVWAVQLDLLKAFMDLCDRHHLRYYVDGGTLLGAVRHGGYIPWDDDLDVSMFREDYNKFREIASREFKAPYLFQSEYDYARKGEPKFYSVLSNIETTAIIRRKFHLKYATNQGINIEIFPLDGMPPASERKQFVGELLDCKAAIQKIARKRKMDLSADIGADLAAQMKMYEEIETRYPITAETKKVAGLYFPSRDENVFNYWIYRDTVQLPFEMLTVPAPSGYKEELRQYYGVWKIPTAQFSHGDTFFDTDRPCEYWLNRPSLPNV